MAQTKRIAMNAVEQTTTELRLTGRRGGMVEYVRERRQITDGNCGTVIAESAPLPDEFAVLIDDSGRVDTDELDDEQRAWLDAESSLEVPQ